MAQPVKAHAKSWSIWVSCKLLEWLATPSGHRGVDDILGRPGEKESPKCLLNTRLVKSCANAALAVDLRRMEA